MPRLKYRTQYLGAGNHKNLPWILHMSQRNILPMTIDNVRSELSQLFIRAGLQEQRYTPHSLRRGGGATFFAEEGVKVSDIKRHGKWRTDAIETYLKQASFQTSSVYKFLQNL